MKTLGTLGKEQLQANRQWLRLLRGNLFRQVSRLEEQFERTRDILQAALRFVSEKSRVVRVFNAFPGNFGLFVDEMKRRSELSFFLEHLLRKVSQIISSENQRRTRFVQRHADSVPAQVT